MAVGDKFFGYKPSEHMSDLNANGSWSDGTGALGNSWMAVVSNLPAGVYEVDVDAQMNGPSHCWFYINGSLGGTESCYFVSDSEKGYRESVHRKYYLHMVANNPIRIRTDKPSGSPLWCTSVAWKWIAPLAE